MAQTFVGTSAQRLAIESLAKVADRFLTTDSKTLSECFADGAWVEIATGPLSWKDAVRLATTADITLSGNQSIDGVMTADGDRVLVKNQAVPADNGIYVADSGAWTRATDFDEDAEVKAGAVMVVNEGTVSADKKYVLTTNDPITVGVTGLVFQLFTLLNHKDTHKSGGTDAFTASDLLEAVVKRLQVTGPVTLLMGAVADGQALVRSGTAIIGAAPGSDILDEYELSGGQMVNTVAGDRPAAVVGNAPSVADTVNASIKVHRYDDTIVEGRKWRRFIPVGALTMKILTQYRAQAAPGDAVHDWRARLYYRQIRDGTASPSVTWTAGGIDGSKDLTEVANITDDVFPHHAPEETLTLASLSPAIVAGKWYEFIWARIAPAGTNLVGDLDILGHKIKMEK